MKEESLRQYRQRPGERGAALVTSLLISLLLLTAGSALLLSTGMAASNSVDATAEAQAYYAAEAGLQTALSVIRRNVPPTVAGTPPTFRNFVCGSANPCTNNGDMSLWVTSAMRTLSASPSISFTLKVQDKSKIEGAAIAANDEPRFLIITARGYGPRGATKVLRMVVDAYPFDFTAKAAVAVRSSDVDSTPMERLQLGNSDPHLWNGYDQAVPPQTSLPAFAVTNTADYDAGDGFGLPTATPPNLQGSAEAAIGADQANILGPQQLVKLPISGLETWLQTADNARAFLAAQRERANTLGRLNPGDIGTYAQPQFTFIDGDLEMNGGTYGAGLLIVTGTLTQHGSSGFKGVVLVLGQGKVVRDGTPDSLGALIVAKFDRNGTTGFEGPYIDSQGGGNALVGYDSQWVKKALTTGGATVLGIIEQ
jgi:Tfp pilus assembly protein PilX